MNRIIKFRFWNSNHKRMFEHFEGWEYDVGINQMLSMAENEYGHVIMQFTGHQDKNGVDIYEGDVVVSFKKVYEDSESTNTVKMMDGCWRLDCAGKNDIPLFNYNPTELEVIGNIYETPNFLPPIQSHE